MANFRYKVKDLNGEAHKGEIEAGDEHTAALILRKKGLVVISIKLSNKKEGDLFDQVFNRVSFNDVVTLTRQLATMVGAGLVLSEAIDILIEQQSNKKLKKALEEISHDIKGGLPLATALGQHPDIFPAVYRNLVKAGESSGKLDEVLLKMADGLEKDREFRARIKGALIYPIIVIVMMISVMIIMMVFVIPKLTDLYKESTLDLPLPTKILISMSDLFVNFWWVGIILTIILVVAFRRWVKTPDGALGYDKLLLKIPLVGKIIQNTTMTNFNRTFGLLISAGVPLLEAISMVTDLTTNMVYKNALKACYAGVEKGLSFSAQINALPVFPKITGQMIRVGEETGKLDEVFYKMAEFFESESDHLVKNLTTAIEPIVIIILGLGVAFLVISIILPIYKLTTSF